MTIQIAFSQWLLTLTTQCTYYIAYLHSHYYVIVLQYFTYCLLLAMLACSQFLGTSGRTKFIILSFQFVIYTLLVLLFAGNIYDNTDLLNQGTFT